MDVCFPCTNPESIPCMAALPRSHLFFCQITQTGTTFSPWYKYTDIQELTAKMIHEFVEKIYVYKAERIDGRRVQRIRIVWTALASLHRRFLHPTENKKNRHSR